MEIGIIGTGSVGMLCAAYLAKEHIVTVYTRRKEQSDLINEKGIILIHGDQKTTVKDVKARSGKDFKEPLLIIAVKQYQLGDVLPLLKKTKERKNLLFLQNGMSHIPMLESLEGHNVYIGSVEHGSLKTGDGTVEHTGAGVIKVSSLFPDQPPLSLAALDSVRFPFKAARDWKEAHSRKLLANAVINPLTALLKVKNGELTENPYYSRMAKSVFKEASGILGITDENAEWEKVMEICRRTAENRSSMLRDTEAGRKTEIDGIIGYLLDEAKKQKTRVPLLEFLYHAVKGGEKE
ncbi:2-dehydropantoate 2-reductase [Metabacillus indicus]|uniref:2-dehydropantoate 2-reductase n=1 Tax=Metabacillus indicus TaxID=246786 RepID=UPI002A057445|nr:2-dehydropantoate 2-reductase [Metabacillus indicus]MDX8288251.1 2-dehydropantoate 2-reductase [Metabacillus indicus]